MILMKKTHEKTQKSYLYLPAFPFRILLCSVRHCNQQRAGIVAKDPAYVIIACIKDREEWLALWLKVPHMTVAGDQISPRQAASNGEEMNP